MVWCTRALVALSSFVALSGVEGARTRSKRQERRIQEEVEVELEPDEERELEHDDDDEDTFDRDDDRAASQGVDRRMVYPSDDASDDFGAQSDDTFAMNMSNIGTQSAVCARDTGGRRVVSMADQHGDFEGMVDHLRRLGLVKSGVNKSSSTWSRAWTGGTAIFVQTGDILDRGPDGRAMYKFLWALQDDAPRSGGEVVLLVGNHELMVLQGDVRYVTDIDFCTYTSDSGCRGSGNYPSNPCNYANGLCSSDPGSCMQGNCEFIASWDRNGEMGSEMRKRFTEGKMKVAYMVNGISFVHAGLVNTLWSKISLRDGEDPIAKLNAEGARLFNSSSGRDLRYSRHVVAAGGSNGGPLWTRMCYDNWLTRSGRRRSGVGSSGPYYMNVDEFNALDGSSRCSVVHRTLRRVPAERMVIGHCPQRDGLIKASCSNRYIMADTYMSIAYTDSRSTSTRNMAAIEFYTGDTPGRAWVAYVGTGRCSELGSVG